MKEILGEVEKWRENGEKVVVATVIATRRSAPRPVGTSLAVSESGMISTITCSMSSSIAWMVASG